MLTLFCFFLWSAPPSGVEFALVPLHFSKFYPEWKCSPKKRSSSTLLPFCVTSFPNCHQARVRFHDAFVYQVKRLNTVGLAILAD